MKLKKSAGLAIIYNNMILLGHTASRGWWKSYGIPKGGLEKGESNLDAAIRETFEEVGVKVPKSLIDPTEHTFTVGTKKYGNKIVYYYIVKIDDLSQIGLKDIKVPKSQLQIEEIDHASFMTYREASKRIMPSQGGLLTNLLNQGLLESNLLNFNEFGKRNRL